MAKRSKHLQGLLGPLETDVMEMTWQLGEATVRDVHAELAERRDLAYTTIMTTMARLAAKGLLERDTSGLAHRYRPTVTREAYARSTVASVVDWLVQSFPEPAMSYFVEKIDDSSDVDVLSTLWASIDAKRAEEDL
ncbi:MAG: BlaI/MecI/CopY family transcriptional regulator [Euzebya sp.]